MMQAAERTPFLRLRHVLHPFDLPGTLTISPTMSSVLEAGLVFGSCDTSPCLMSYVFEHPGRLY